MPLDKGNEDKKIQIQKQLLALQKLIDLAAVQKAEDRKNTANIITAQRELIALFKALDTKLNEELVDEVDLFLLLRSQIKQKLAEDTVVADSKFEPQSAFMLKMGAGSDKLLDAFKEKFSIKDEEIKKNSSGCVLRFPLGEDPIKFFDEQAKLGITFLCQKLDPETLLPVKPEMYVFSCGDKQPLYQGSRQAIIDALEKAGNDNPDSTTKQAAQEGLRLFKQLTIPSTVDEYKAKMETALRAPAPKGVDDAAAPVAAQL